ncbi:hypothetical protein T05_5772 [Trichinella murrelli]|uniref:Uncharacterized protein n=1 Tax=Trichinella murrelli TaxID=144512 RepID=A0A0V0SPP2_9BILA|nr:hypothetical protein T05_5772 [Trichinella murrelli]
MALYLNSEFYVSNINILQMNITLTCRKRLSLVFYCEIAK